MNYLFGFVLAVAGLAVLIWNKPLSTRLGRFTAHRHSMTFGRLAHYVGADDPNKPFNVFFYRLLVIFAGAFLLLMAFHTAFGTIYTGSAAQPTNSLLYAPNQSI